MFSYNLIISEALIFAMYIFICLTLLKPRGTYKTRALACGVTVLCSCAAAAVISVLNGVLTAMTLPALFAYLPFSVCVYIFSEEGLFETAAACSVGVLCSLIVKTVKKLLTNFIGNDIALVILTALLCAACAFVVHKSLRKTFSAVSLSGNRTLVIVPISTVFLAMFYNLNTTNSTAVSVVTLILAVSLFATASRLFAYSEKIAGACENEKRLAESLEMQRKNFEQISQSVDAGRIYRHDMRHHLRVISGMAQQNNSTEITEYIDKLNESAEFGAAQTVCQNPAVNAVLWEYINRAEKLGCKTEYNILIPKELPFDIPDVCVIISNALDNALKACVQCSDERYINISADLSDDRKLKVIVRNSCDGAVKLGEDGLPVITEKNDSHGLGLRGVKKTVEKYNGFVNCACENGEFVFCAEIFRDPEGANAGGGGSKRSRAGSKALPAVIAAVACAVVIPAISPVTAQAFSDVFSVKVRTLDFSFGGTELNMEFPQFTGEGADQINQTVDGYIDEAKKLFRTYVLQKYEGYVAEEGGYVVYEDGDRYLSVRFYATLNVGGSMDYSRCITIDKKTRKEIALADLFDEERDYISEISAEVTRQMELRTEEGHKYFIPGGIWTDEECFKTITPDQQFYIAPDGRLVIVFDEYTVAPGSEGAPEFIMPLSVYGE